MTNPTLRRWVRVAISAVLLGALAGCGGGSGYGGGSGGGGGGTTYTVGGMVTGLTGSGLVLQINSAGDLAVPASGAFTFVTGLASGVAYAVTVQTQPTNPNQTCVVTNGSGTMGATNVTNVAVTCTNTFTVGGVVSGLIGSGLVLNTGYWDYSTLNITTNGAFTLLTDVASGDSYGVVVTTQPTNPAQICLVTNGSGTMGSSNISNVAVICSSAERVAYAANAGSSTISAYTIESTGALTAVGAPVATGTSPLAIAGSPDGHYVYVGNETDNNISVYAVNATTGALTPISGPPVATGIDPQALAFDPSGAYLYVANYGSDNLSAYAVNASTGALTPLTTAMYATGTGPSAISVDPYGKFVFVANKGGSNDVSVFAITTGTGALTPVVGSPFPATSGNPQGAYSPVPYSLVLGAAGRYLYVATTDNFIGSGVSAFSVDPVTGALTLLRNSAVDVSGYIATDRTGKYLYVTNGSAVNGYSIDATTGELSALAAGPVVTGATAYSIAIDPTNQFLYVGNGSTANISGYQLDAATGGLTAIPGSPFTSGNLPEFIVTL